MTEFKELNLNKDVGEMSEDELRETLTDFMDAHQSNQTAYDEQIDAIQEAETEYREQVDALEEKVAEFKQERAEEAAEHVKMPAELLAERFSFSELDKIIEEGEEAEFSEEEEEDDDAPESLTTFSDRPQKGKTEGGSETSQYRDMARDALRNKGMAIRGE